MACKANTVLSLVVAALVGMATFPEHQPSNYRLGCLAVAFVLWKILRLSVEGTK